MSFENTPRWLTLENGGTDANRDGLRKFILAARKHNKRCGCRTPTTCGTRTTMGSWTSPHTRDSGALRGRRDGGGARDGFGTTYFRAAKSGRSWWTRSTRTPFQTWTTCANSSRPCRGGCWNTMSEAEGGYDAWPTPAIYVIYGAGRESETRPRRVFALHYPRTANLRNRHGRRGATGFSRPRLGLSRPADESSAARSRIGGRGPGNRMPPAELADSSRAQKYRRTWRFPFPLVLPMGPRCEISRLAARPKFLRPGTDHGSVATAH